MRRTRQRCRQSGMTLIEVLIALVVFSIGALGVLGMVTITMHLNVNSRQTSEASQLAIRQMENLQLVQVATADTQFTSCGTRCWLRPDLALQASAVALQPANLLGGTTGSTLYYQLSWRTTAFGNLKYIEVNVHWPKNRSLGGTDWTSVLDCQANPVTCYTVQFHSYHP